MATNAPPNQRKILRSRHFSCSHMARIDATPTTISLLWPLQLQSEANLHITYGIAFSSSLFTHIFCASVALFLCKFLC